MRGKNNWQRVGSKVQKTKEFIRKGGLHPWYWNYRFKWNNYPKMFKVGSFPTEVIIETSSICNLKCVMCFRNYLPTETKYSLMDLELFKKIIDECKKEKIAAVKLSWRGEVLLNKDFVKMVKYAKEAGIREVSTLTNATHLTPEVAKGLIEAGLDYLVFSVDGSTKETYEKIRIGANFEQVVENIKQFHRLRSNKKKPQTRIQLTEIEQNKNEVQPFINHWRNKVDEIAISGFIDYSYIDEEQDSQVQDVLRNAKGRLPCSSLWQRLAIMSDGTATVCCVDVQGKLALGNVKDQTIKELWRGFKLNKLRELHQQKRLNEIEACRKCNARTTYEF